jgi:integrase
MAAARKSSRYGHRDATMILIGYRHGLPASELCDLQWSQVELAIGRLHVRRAKNGSPSERRDRRAAAPAARAGAVLARLYVRAGRADQVVCLTLAKWETVSGQFGGYLRSQVQQILTAAAEARPTFSISCVNQITP